MHFLVSYFLPPPTTSLISTSLSSLPYVVNGPSLKIQCPSETGLDKISVALGLFVAMGNVYQ